MIKHTLPSNQQAAEAAATYLSQKVGHNTNLFFSGGSSADVLAALNSVLSDEQKKGVQLFMVDERYGDKGHESSNEHVLGFDVDAYAGVSLVLREGLSLEQTADEYAAIVEKAFDDGQSTNIAILGIGSDDHIAGIKPMTSVQYKAIFSGSLAVGYDWDDFQRITITERALIHMQHAVVFAGASKAEAVGRIDSSVAEHIQPSSILTRMPDVQIYNVNS